MLKINCSVLLNACVLYTAVCGMPASMREPSYHMRCCAVPWQESGCSKPVLAV